MSDPTLNNEATGLSSGYPSPDTVLEYTRRANYGRIKSLSPLASNNPRAFCAEYTTFPSQKAIFPISCTSLHDHRQIYETQIHPTIIQCLEKARNLGNLLAIHPVRLGFIYPPPPTGSEPARTILLVFKKGSLDQSTTEELLSRLEKQITKICETNNIEEIFIDICETHYSSSDSSSNEDLGSKQLFDNYPQLPEEPTPRIGASIGPKGTGLTGSLSFYLYHGEEVYAVTNCHVMGHLPHQRERGDTSSIPAYRYQEGEEKIVVESPSPRDRESIRVALNKELPGLRIKIQNLEEERLLKEASGAPWPRKKEENLSYCQQELRKREDWINWLDSHTHVLGYLKATSGLVPPPPNEGRKDWAIIEVNDNIKSLCQNKHRSIETSAQAYSIRGYGLINIENHGISEEEANKTRNASWHFSYLGNEIPLLQSGSFSAEINKLFLKPPSARSMFRDAIYNGLRHTLRLGPGGLTREHVVINPASDRVGVSEDGDSGSCILDMSDFKAVGMVWGGARHQVGFDHGAENDVTYVTPLLEMIKDIERSMGWEIGSSHL